MATKYFFYYRMIIKCENQTKCERAQGKVKQKENIWHLCLRSYFCRRGCFVPPQVSKANHGKSPDSARSLVPSCCDCTHSGHGPAHTEKKMNTNHRTSTAHRDRTVGFGYRLCINKQKNKIFRQSWAWKFILDLGNNMGDK